MKITQLKSIDIKECKEYLTAAYNELIMLKRNIKRKDYDVKSVEECKKKLDKAYDRLHRIKKHNRKKQEEKRRKLELDNPFKYAMIKEKAELKSKKLMTKKSK